MNLPKTDLNELITGNTLIVVNRFGPTLIYFYEGGQFRQIGQHGQSSEGLWRVTDKNLCVTVTSLPPDIKRKEYSVEMSEKSLGCTWTNEDSANGMIAYKLVEGHPAFKKKR